MAQMTQMGCGMRMQQPQEMQQQRMQPPGGMSSLAVRMGEMQTNMQRAWV